MFAVPETKRPAATPERSAFAKERTSVRETGPLRRLSRPGVGVSEFGPQWNFATMPIFSRGVAGALQPKLAIGAVNDPLEREADRVADQVTGRAADPGRVAFTGPQALQRCAKCQEEEEKLQKKPSGRGDGVARTEAPASVLQALRSAGRPLDATTRAYLEPRFGYDFSHVRLHTDDGASRSAGEVGARAYTVGRQIVFGAGQYDPESTAGRRLLAHELTHVVQQNAAGPIRGPAAGAVSGQTDQNLVQRAPNPLDASAKTIIDAAKDTKMSAEDRAKAVVNAIVNQYYPGEKDKVDSVVWTPDLDGLSTKQKGSGATATGIIQVGQKFLNQSISSSQDFARSVLQVGHELQHVDQQRQGMGGADKSHEREFLAFYWESTQPEKAGTGRMSHPTRVDLIDAALGNFYCLSADQQNTYEPRQTELLTLRGKEQTKYKDPKKHPKTDPPTSCGGSATPASAPPAASTSPAAPTSKLPEH